MVAVVALETEIAVDETDGSNYAAII